MYCTIHRYDTIYTIHTYVSDNSQALTIRNFLYTIRIPYHTILTTMVIITMMVMAGPI